MFKVWTARTEDGNYVVTTDTEGTVETAQMMISFIYGVVVKEEQIEYSGCAAKA